MIREVVRILSSNTFVIEDQADFQQKKVGLAHKMAFTMTVQSIELLKYLPFHLLKG